MTTAAPLTARQSARLITALQHGQPLDEAAADLRLDLTAVWATARTDTRLIIALAGRDPDAAAEHGRAARAEYLRLLALGVSPSTAELILESGHAGTWRGSDRAYARACAAVSEAAAPCSSTRQVRLTPERVARFLDELRMPGTTVKAAAQATGITTVAIYQRRRRDPSVRAGDGRRAAVRPGVTGRSCHPGPVDG